MLTRLLYYAAENLADRLVGSESKIRTWLWVPCTPAVHIAMTRKGTKMLGCELPPLAVADGCLTQGHASLPPQDYMDRRHGFTNP